MRKIVYFLILFGVFTLLGDSVYAESMCVFAHRDSADSKQISVYSVNYDYFCGKNEAGVNCHSKTDKYGSKVYALFGYGDMKNPANGDYRSVDNKEECYVFDESFYFDACYKFTDINTNSSFYANSEVFVQSEGIYLVELVERKYCANLVDNTIHCKYIGEINKKIPEITSWLITILQVSIPIILIIIGSIDFVKAVASQKEDEMKKSQQIFIKRLIAAALVFLLVAITKLLVSVVSTSKSESKSIGDCIECFINGKCD